MTLILVLNLHGTINSSEPVRRGLEELKVSKRFTASVVTEDASTLGLLKLCKGRVAWSQIDADLLTALLKKRGMVTSTKALDAGSLKKMGYKDHGELAAKMLKDGMRLSAVEGLRPYFRLAPPKGGFKLSMRRAASEHGVLGSNPKLGDLVRRMM